MDGVSGVASVIAVCGLLEACIKGLRQLYNTLKFAKRDLRQLIEEVYICQGLFDIFEDVTRPLGSEVMRLAREKKLDEALQTQANSALQQIEQVITKFKPLLKDSSPSSFDELFAKIRWHFTKQEIQALMVTFSTVKNSLGLLSCLLTLESSLLRFSQQSTANGNHDLLDQIARLEQTVRRQNKSLKRLAKTLNNTIQNVHGSPLISNTESMIVIIKQIQKVPVAEARAVIAREGRNNSSHFISPTPRARDPMSLQNSRNTRRSNTQLPSGSRFPSVIVSLQSEEIPHQENTFVSRERRGMRDYGDGNREYYEGGSSSSSIRRSRHNNHVLFVPNPPFTQADWDTRNREKGDSRQSP